MVLASFWACVLTDDSRYVENDEKCMQYEKDLMANPRMPIVGFW